MSQLTVAQRRNTAWLGMGVAAVAVAAGAIGILLWPDSLRISLVAGIALLVCVLAMIGVAARPATASEDAVLRMEGRVVQGDEPTVRLHCSSCRHFTEAPDDGARPLQVRCANCGKQGVVD